MVVVVPDARGLVIAPDPDHGVVGELPAELEALEVALVVREQVLAEELELSLLQAEQHVRLEHLVLDLGDRVPRGRRCPPPPRWAAAGTPSAADPRAPAVQPTGADQSTAEKRACASPIERAPADSDKWQAAELPIGSDLVTRGPCRVRGLIVFRSAPSTALQASEVHGSPPSALGVGRIQWQAKCDRSPEWVSDTLLPHHPPRHFARPGGALPQARPPSRGKAMRFTLPTLSAGVLLAQLCGMPVAAGQAASRRARRRAGRHRRPPSRYPRSSRDGGNTGVRRRVARAARRRLPP